MDRDIKSEAAQRRKGTWARNEYIRSLYTGRNGAELGRDFNISRQAIHQIIKGGKDGSE